MDRTPPLKPPALPTVSLPAGGSTDPRPDLHVLIETLPDAVLIPVRDLLLFVYRHLMIPGVLLVFDMLCLL